MPVQNHMREKKPEYRYEKIHKAVRYATSSALFIIPVFSLVTLKSSLFPFIDGKAFSIIHTTSLYNLYESSCKFEVGMHYLPGNVSRDSEIGGCVLLIPSKNKQEVKNAAWKLLSYLTGKEVNMLWARETGYMPTRNSVLDTSEARDYLAKKPAFKPVFTFLDNINPRIQHPAYTALAKLWMQEMAKVIIEGGDVASAMQKMAKLIDEALQD